MKNETLKSRVFGTVALNSAALELNGQTFTPDATKAYASFTLARGFPVLTAYGTCVHPATVANSFQSMEHQLVDYDHQLKCYGNDKKPIRDDNIIGTVVAVDFPRTPLGGWKLGRDKAQAPALHGIMVIHKKAAKVQQVLGEHLTGKHKWTVSMEMEYGLAHSGFVVSDRAAATPEQEALMSEQTPRELTDLGLGYVALEGAPDSLTQCFSLPNRKIVAAWGQLPVALMQGGLAGEVHFGGVGIVRYGAEREAEIQELLASDPDALEQLEDGSWTVGADYFRTAAEGLEALGAAFRSLYGGLPESKVAK